MILTIDVGNTNITCGVFKGDEIVATFRITTKMPRTSDEYGMILYNLLEQNEIKPSDIKDTIMVHLRSIFILPRLLSKRASRQESAS